MAFFQRKKFGTEGKKGAIPDGLWMKCVQCKQTVYKSEVEQNMETCPACGHHYRIGARQRLELMLDPGSFEETHAGLTTMDPLKFAVGQESYLERIQRARKQSGLNEAIITGFGTIEGNRLGIGAMDSSFIMASMGSAVGEKVCRLIKDCIREQVPAVIFCASGGARMQEGILALMQMAKTSDAVRQMNEAGLPYITVLTDPTSGGVFASFASIGDIVLAEPQAYIGFAGARLIEGALKVKVPDGFQRSEYQMENGFIDEIVKRTELRSYLGKLLKYLPPEQPEAESETLRVEDVLEPVPAGAEQE